MYARLGRWHWFFFALSGVALFCVASFSGFVAHVAAQELSVSQPITLDSAAENGSIISYDGQKYSLSSVSYDTAMMGVSTTQAAIELTSVDGLPPDTYPVISTGITNVRVSTENGPIQIGDFLTSSSKPGVAMKADKSGFILGVAQSNYDGTEEGVVPVLLTIKFAFSKESPVAEKIRVQLSDLLKLSGLTILDDPITSLRYLLAACVIIASLVVTFMTVGKVARGGVDAIGRNPLASKAIILSIIMNTVLSIGIVGMGLAAAYFISTV